jgi:tetratricopeptide (TPR) repeat protein
MRRFALALAALLLALAALRLAAATAAPEAPDPIDVLVERLEQKRDRSPRDADARVELGAAYYRRARRALDAKAWADYERDLEKALAEIVEAARLEPESSEPHVYMGIVAVYQGDLDRALRSFANARQLSPRGWTHYTNIAQIMTYRGATRRDIERWIGRAERLRAEPEEVDLVLCLASWRDGNMAGAERHFKRVRRLGPKLLERWDGAPLAKPLATLPDLIAYCCANPACGPYLSEACRASEQEVVKREIPAQTARRELLLEMERRRKLDAIYRQRRDLEIEVEKPEGAAPAPEPAPAP